MHEETDPGNRCDVPHLWIANAAGRVGQLYRRQTILTLSSSVGCPILAGFSFARVGLSFSLPVVLFSTFLIVDCKSHFLFRLFHTFTQPCQTRRSPSNSLKPLDFPSPPFESVPPGRMIQSIKHISIR